MSVEALQQENAQASFDAESHIAFITYHGVLTAATSIAVYDWLADLTEAVGLDNVYGEVFDFREVEQFMPDNLISARKNSRRMNMRNNVKKLPVAMIVKDFVQEEILRGPMQNPKENQRKRIVRTMDEALTFITGYHQQQTPEAE
jgi:hypothetical protein